MTEPRRDEVRSWLTPKTVASAVLLVAVIAFAIDNRRDVRVGYVFGDGRASLILIIVAMLLVGAFVGYVVGRRR